MTSEWNLDSRWQMQQIVPNLFIGPYNVALNKESLVLNGITTIVIIKSVQESFLKEFHPMDFKYFTIIMNNSNLERLDFNSTNQLLNSLLTSGERIFVHCVGGICRAPTVVIGYLISIGNSFNYSFNLVQNSRLCINPLDSFIMQLKVIKS